MPFTILHISDLHRAQTDPIGNDELLSTLIADRARAANEDPGIGAPDAIVVTGDLVQGVPLGFPEHEAELDRQHAVALDFLTRLAEEFLDGDRARLVMLPGNHDVDWNCSKAAMRLVDDADVPPGFSPTMCGPADDWRWSWAERRAHQIVDRLGYDQRLARFHTLADTFYADIDISRTDLYRMHPLFHDRIVIVAFDSCVGNDCYANHGQIAESAIATAHLELERLPYELRVAAWHHSVGGEPAATDYLSISTVHRLIGRGFRLGMHGHQHRAAAANTYVHLPDEEAMAVVSAGSLCAGRAGLPPGVNRQYNLIEIGDDLTSARVHVREMAIATNFAPARRAEFGFSSHLDLKWTLPADTVRQRSGYEQNLILDAERANHEQRFEDAERILDQVPTTQAGYARTLLLAALREQRAWGRLAEAVSEPQSIEELVTGTTALADAGEYSHAEEYLARHREALKLPASTTRELRGIITTKRSLG